jgi:hypothetical protein
MPTTIPTAILNVLSATRLAIVISLAECPASSPFYSNPAALYANRGSARTVHSTFDLCLLPFDFES